MGYQHIMVPVDGSSTSLTAIQHAAKLATTYQSTVTVIYVLTIDPFINIEYINSAHQVENDALKQTREIIKTIVDEAKQKFLTFGIDANTVIIEGQDVHKEIIKASEEHAVDLIVIGSHGRTGIRKLVLGSVTQKLLGETSLPVLVVHK
ncbi:universal stress protein [Acinetobacter soli]|uniref:universal stress protein n=1 Tax=Acinetobacter soli TaxID=487316 RepID=UPI00124FFEBF|nr:universal stress protein [Acinetobacter soli]